MAYPATSIGNQFPTTGFVSNVDLHNKIDVPLDAVAAAVNAAPLGYLSAGKTTGPGNYSTSATVASAAFSYVAGRQYRITGYFQGVQNTSTGIVNVALGGTGITPNIAFLGGVSAGTTADGSVSCLFSPASSGSTTALLVASTSAATITIATGAFVMVEDLGT